MLISDYKLKFNMPAAMYFEASNDGRNHLTKF